MFFDLTLFFLAKPININEEIIERQIVVGIEITNIKEIPPPPIGIIS